MKKLYSLLATLSISAFSCALLFVNKDSVKTNAITLPNTITLNDTSEADIRSYYSYLDTLPESERRGTNLLKNLKYILVNNPSNTAKPSRYFTYNQVRSIYNITDREWISSPKENISGYDASTNTIASYSYSSETPNLYYYYRADNFTNPHTSNAKVTSSDSKTQTLLNQEHLWSVSHGFKPTSSSSSAVENAGTDLHHLVAGDATVNKWGHSNYTYGNVDVEDSDWINTKTRWDNGDNAILGNKRGTPKYVNPLNESQIVFEPQDADKGDIARALMYMAARYNHYDGTASSASITEPDLELVDYSTDESVTITCNGTNGTGKYGILSDLLSWHNTIDPIDTSSNSGYYEVHRNNLIYENYQYTRNPFIDFPSWADYVWGSKKDSGAVSPSTDPLYSYESVVKPTSFTLNTTSLSLTSGDTFQAQIESITPSDASKSLIWSTSDANVATVSESGSIKAVGVGSCIINAKSSLDNNVSASISISVSGISVTGISLNKTSTNLNVGAEEQLTATISPSDATNKNIVWSSSDSSIVSVDNGLIKALQAGQVTISATSEDGNFSATCLVNVSSSTNIKYYEKIESTSSLTDGNYIIACEYASIAFNGGLSQADLFASNNNVSISTYLDTTTNRIESNATTDGLIFTYNATKKTLKSASGYYIGTNSSSASISANETTKYQVNITFSAEGDALIASATQSAMVLQVYQSKNFKFYSSSQKPVQLYKLMDRGSSSGSVVTSSYKLINTLEDVTSGQYVIAALHNNTYFGLSNTFPAKEGSVSATALSVSNDSLVGDVSSFVVSIVRTNNLVTISNGTTYLSYSGNSTNMIESSKEYSFTISLANNIGTFNLAETTSGRSLSYSTSGNYFKAYASIKANTYLNLELFKYEEVTVAYTALDFANDFINSVICDANGVNKPTFKSGYSWDKLKSLYTSLSSSDQSLLQTATAIEYSDDIIAKAMYRYDYIVSKYYQSGIDKSFVDFITRNPVLMISNNFDYRITQDNNIVIILSAIFITMSVTGILIIRKRKTEQ